jgi:hypothetical protein
MMSFGESGIRFYEKMLFCFCLLFSRLGLELT